MIKKLEIRALGENFAKTNLTSTRVPEIRRGAFDFIQKPFDPDYLLATIEKAVTTREPGFNEWKTEGPKEKFEKLTYRQKQVLTDISKGVPSRFIADHLNISIRTVERHRQNGMRKCGVKSTQELIDFLRKVKTLRTNND